MTKKLFLGAFVGGIIAYVWMMISWMVIPWHKDTLKTFTDESGVAQVISQNAPQAGVYVLPNTFSYDQGTPRDQMEKGMKMMENGPYMMAAVRPNGVNFMSPQPYIMAFITQFIGALIVTWMLIQAKGLGYGKKWLLVALYGLAVGILSQIPMWNWWGFSSCYVTVAIIDYVIAWALAGFALAGIVKVKK